MSKGPVVVVMGVTGSGKSTVGRPLAAALRVPFVDGDDFHSAESIEKMRRGQPLDDDDREPWLDRLNAQLRVHRDGVVLACSALTERYRERLTRGVDEVQFVLLTAPSEVLRARIDARTDHFANADLLPSQLALLEPPANAIVVDVAEPTADVVEQIVASLRAS